MIKTMFIAAAILTSIPAFAQTPAAMPMCSAKVTDSCQQTAAQQARAMSGAQADARDARAGGAWAPNKTAAKAPANKK